MSYSRWSYSKWYTYSDTTLINDEPTFTICDVMSFPLSMLRDLDNALGHVVEKCPEATEDELYELGQYMEEFINDYDNPNSAHNILKSLDKDNKFDKEQV